MIRLPHILSYTLTTATEPTRNESGDLITGTSTSVSKTVKCRLQPNVRASYLISEADGSRLDFAAVVYLAADADSLKVGQSVTVSKGIETIHTGSVKRFHRGQLHCSLWI